MTEFITEQPIVSEEGPRRDLARQVAEWICTQPISSSLSSPTISSPRPTATTSSPGSATAQTSPAPRGHVAGIYGSRGSGKTSFLFTLLAELRATSTRGETTASQSQRPLPCPLVLPRADYGHLRLPVFKPSETRDHDGLLLMLLRHIEDLYSLEPQCRDHPESRDDLVRSIQRADVIAKQTDLFLSYDKEISPSVERLRDLYVATLTEAATTTLTIRRHFHELLQHRVPSDGRLVLLIDDVDLQPHRALELLELCHFFLDHPSVFIVLAADKPLLLHAIDQELRENRTHQAGLATALLAKYVPYSWMLPVPTHQEVWDSLLRDLDPWWSREGMSLLSQANATLERDGETQVPIIDGADALEEVRPRTYRELSALINALRAWKTRLSPSAREDSSSNDKLVAFHDAVQDRYNSGSGLGLLRPLAAPFLVLLAAVEVRWPDLGLLESIETEPARLLSALSPMLLTDPAVSQPPPLELPVLTALRDESLYSPVRRGQARQALHHVAKVLESWRRVNATAGAAERFLFVTLHGHAKTLTNFQRLWKSQLTEEEANRSHLDLHEFAKGGHPNGTQVRLAKEHARPLLDALLTGGGRIWLCAQAPLSFLAWLGSTIDYRRPIVAWNARDLVELEVPPRLQMPKAEGPYEVTKCIWSNDGVASHADVIFDFLEGAAPDSLSAFPAPDTDDASAADLPLVLGCRLVYQGSGNFHFGDVTSILLDVLELLRELRERGVSTIRVGLHMPDVVAFALGRQLRSRGFTIELHERVGARYESAIVLEE